MAKDKVIEKDDGWYCVVGGREHGSWRSRAEAVGGMQVEQRRHRARLARQRVCTCADEDFCLVHPTDTPALDPNGPWGPE